MDQEALTPDRVTGLRGPLVRRVRWLAVRGLAAVATGIVVLGIGGRLVMLGSRLLHAGAIGRVTENGDKIGEFTVEGTFVLIVTGGVLGGAVAAVVWVIVWQWIPRHPVVVGLGAVALGGFNLIDADNRDFVILRDAFPGLAPDLALLVGLVFVFGASLVWVDRWLDARLPEGTGTVSIIVYSLIVVVGVPFLIPTIASFVSTEFCFCDNPPVATGFFIVITAIATAWWWVLNLRGSRTPPRTLTMVGTASVALAVIAGTIHLIGEIASIL